MPWTGRLAQLNTLAGRLAVLQLLVLAILLPVLGLRLDAVMRDSTNTAVIGHARAYALSLASEFELSDTLESPTRTIVLLDSVIQGGRGRYAAIDFGGRLLGSSLADTPADVRSRRDSTVLGVSMDHVFSLSAPVRRAGRAGVLYLGIDELPSLADIRAARYQIAGAMLLYAIASLLAALALARAVSIPLVQLQTASRAAARGDPEAHIAVDSSMAEIAGLAHDIEFMRGELVGTAARLRAEMLQRESEQVQRSALEDQLRHEQRLATLGTFAGGVAHEFNNILLPLLLNAEEALAEVPAGHPARRNLEQIIAATEKAKNIVSRILTFSARGRTAEPAAIDVSAVVGETLDLFRALVPRNVELLREIAAPGAKVLCDPILLGQVVLNLCSNSLRAMGERGGTLSVALAAQAESGTVTLRVRDTGHGMSPEVRERIFEPFFTTGNAGEGTGLGLPVVHGIVAGMGGSISVVSAPGAGAEFSVILPASPPGTRA